MISNPAVKLKFEFPSEGWTPGPEGREVGRLEDVILAGVSGHGYQIVVDAHMNTYLRYGSIHHKKYHHE
jgi:hypothetical protein